MAWQCISPEVTVKVFRKCCISSALIGDVRSECEEDGDSDTDWQRWIESDMLCVFIV